MNENDKTAPAPAVPTLQQQAGISKEEANKSIKELNVQFAKQADENGQLRRALIAMQAQIDVLTAKKNAGKFGQVPVEMRHCNHCGTQVEEGERCPRHKAAKINEIGMGMLHNRMQPIILRQV
jgi:hypothetical protein